MLSNIRIVLVNTSHPGNIGAAARAMKTMGLSSLYLVAPDSFPDFRATEMASGAADLLEKAVVVDSLATALADCQLVMGTSARSRTIPWPMLDPRQCAELANKEAAQAQVAILFGRERMGLTNEELQLCHYHVEIPSAPEYSSLNIAAAVQVITYELRVASLHVPSAEKAWDYPLAKHEDLERFYQQLEQVLLEIKFLNPKAPRQLLPRLRRLFNRTRLDEMEINILRGILSAIQNKS